jgi:hypothetical protein
MDNAPFWIALMAVAASFGLMAVLKLRRPETRLESSDADDGA